MSLKNHFARNAMREHTKIYLDFHGYSTADTILCEACGGVAVDIHHISAKGMGGNHQKNHIGNLIGLCRQCHDKAHVGILTKDELFEIIEPNLLDIG